MQVPLQITFHNHDRSEAIEAKVQERAAKLERYYDGIVRCRVIVEGAHKHHRNGNRYQARVYVTVPEKELVASREPDQHHAYTDVYVAIRDAVDSIRRQLEDYARNRRGQVKAHEIPGHGRIAEINTDGGYGRIESADGRLIYFHRNSVVDADFDRLQVGADVRFDDEMGERGPQASTVYLIGKHHILS
ncbi:MAG: HPF/RaiA family ribosome-associated protein [Betaproteobacteria bacterium]|nr:HPF/RaiA family ribosome-associated protein [Betaproteobacteria bacterium]MDH3437768.1 HPF/RaiA family ribosome-associated protein [Betaproteobacteria bacterium]